MSEKWAWEQTSGGAGWWLTENTEARLYMTRNAAPTEEERNRIGAILNHHEELVAALEAMLPVLDTIPWVAEEVPEGLAPMFYGTLTAEGDRKIHDQYVAARALLARIKGESNERP